MTDNNAAAARRKAKFTALISVGAIVSLALGGCGTGGSPFGGGLLDSTEPAPVASAPAPATGTTASKRVAIAPVIGAPDAVAKQLGDQMIQSMVQQKVAISANPADKPDYTLRGYVVAAREKASIKISYIWDVTDPAGKRVNRVTGEELVPAADSVKDPWSAVTPQVVQTISSKSATSLGSWLSSQSEAPAMAAAQPAPAAATSAVVPPPSAPPAAPVNAAVATGASPAAQPAVATGSQAATPASVGSSAAGLGQGPVAALVPAVTGAPGDGGVSLTGAIQRELAKSGVSLAERAAGGSYVVEGKVKLSSPKDGKQTIEIDWKVKDPKGKALGTVTQKNEVPQGSLDGAWGKTADAAAAAAAQGIVKLLPASSTRTN